ncbi:glutamate decarboxylase-like protein 1 [Plenodomus tracheiphilus IPT5]|uniref:Glutamate decarboxylase-like protein 1 n=1 Tax=Plenodomus tracheiphilus IPT5 TaxID=1408161 RepID=A0A6A7ARU2_9PLEO|nr:glutamate decarboxylase-like protein 1 [Plenodomus tracheiphilus IPT5]
MSTLTEGPLHRADEVQDLLTAVQSLILPFIAAADTDAATKHTGHGLQITGGGPRTALVEHHPPKKLESLLKDELAIEGEGQGKDGLVAVLEKVLQYSVNTWDQGFLDKLYASTNAVGVVSELVLGVLNTNAHVYQVSPALTLIEKHTTAYLASLFNLPASTSGGISQPGGSAANSTAIVVARNTLYPETKTDGNGSHKFTLFTSAHGHYSVEKAANLFGLGSKNVISVSVDEAGRMIPSELEKAITHSKARGETPFFINATAGTTVHGSFDPFPALSTIAKQHNLWLHIDGSWGGSIIFSRTHAATRLAGAHLADSITINPHKMLSVPMTSSFLLGRDMSTFHKALTLPAGYLFHNSPSANANDIYDLADLTPQCGRRADSLKFFLALKYYGPGHFANFVARGYEVAAYLLSLLKSSTDFVTLSPEPLPCLQVCFYFARGGRLGDDAEKNGEVTAAIAHRLIGRGFMVDFAPGERGKFFRVVVNGGTRRGTVEGLVKAVGECAGELGY